jgi:hypothetical protein
VGELVEEEELTLGRPAIAADLRIRCAHPPAWNTSDGV